MTGVAVPSPVQNGPVDAFEVPVAFARSGYLFLQRMARLARRIDGRRFGGNRRRAGLDLATTHRCEIPAKDSALEDGWSDEGSFQAGLAVQPVEAGHLACGVE